jgi:hypothetical protein
LRISATVTEKTLAKALVELNLNLAIEDQGSEGERAAKKEERVQQILLKREDGSKLSKDELIAEYVTAFGAGQVAEGGGGGGESGAVHPLATNTSGDTTHIRRLPSELEKALQSGSGAVLFHYGAGGGPPLRTPMPLWVHPGVDGVWVAGKGVMCGEVVQVWCEDGE